MTSTKRIRIPAAALGALAVLLSLSCGTQPSGGDKVTAPATLSAATTTARPKPGSLLAARGTHAALLKPAASQGASNPAAR